VGVVYILISGIAFGLLPWFSRIAFDHGVEPIGLLTVRFIGAMTCLVLFHLLIRRSVAWPSLKVFGKLVILGAIAYAPQSVFFASGVERIDISLATIIFYTYPVMVVILSWLILKQVPSRAVVVSLMTAVVGTAMTAGQIQTGSWTGVTLMFIAALWYAVSIIIVSRVLKDVDAFMSVTGIMVGASLATVVMWLITRANLPADIQGWSAAFAAAIISTIVALGFLIIGIQRIGPGQASVLSTIEPVVSIAVGVIALNESLTAVRVLGAVLVVIGVAMMAQAAREQVDPESPPTPHAPLE
jgi:drug/metabolite transporter (DMT)-like permease